MEHLQTANSVWNVIDWCFHYPLYLRITIYKIAAVKSLVGEVTKSLLNRFPSIFFWSGSYEYFTSGQLLLNARFNWIFCFPSSRSLSLAKLAKINRKAFRASWCLWDENQNKRVKTSHHVPRHVLEVSFIALIENHSSIY